MRGENNWNPTHLLYTTKIRLNYYQKIEMKPNSKGGIQNSKFWSNTRKSFISSVLLFTVLDKIGRWGIGIVTCWKIEAFFGQWVQRRKFGFFFMVQRFAWIGDLISGTVAWRERELAKFAFRRASFLFPLFLSWFCVSEKRPFFCLAQHEFIIWWAGFLFIWKPKFAA
jgi:hypothetical protein